MCLWMTQSGCLVDFSTISKACFVMFCFLADGYREVNELQWTVWELVFSDLGWYMLPVWLGSTRPS